ncbi:MAG: NAD(P)H-hydrate dehydratase [Candidatus Margulisiibacteriota bacterium]
MDNRVVTREEAKRLDDYAIRTLGIPSVVLMENAGRVSAHEILIRYPWVKSILVFVYKGNNGGDGLVVARYLSAAGKDVKIVLLCNPKDFSYDAKLNFDIAQKLKIPFILANHAAPRKKLSAILARADLVVDAIFGVGLSDKVSGFLAEVIRKINVADKAVKVAVDIPSGLDANTGQVLGEAVRADLTITLAFMKKGLLEPASIKYVGKPVVVDIGIPSNLIFGANSAAVPKPGAVSKGKFKLSAKGITAITSDFISSALKRRAYDSNKGQFGKILIIAGSSSMSGAAILAARAAVKSGAGLVTLAVPESIQGIVAAACVEAIVLSLPQSTSGALCPKSLEKLLPKMIGLDAILVGPGISTDIETKEFFFLLLSRLVQDKFKIPVVIDADGLNCLSENVDTLQTLKFPVVLTPHPGEFARLINKTIAEVQKQRVALAEKFSASYKTTLVLKGADTVCTQGKKKTAINFTGNPGMSSAGVGDVLAGLLVSLVGQGMDPFAAAKTAVFVHGLAADLLERQVGVFGLTASALVELIPVVLKHYYRG